jgi:hypothetical protein
MLDIVFPKMFTFAIKESIHEHFNILHGHLHLRRSRKGEAFGLLRKWVVGLGNH